MPVLFFVAGYFALPSLKRHGVKGFVLAKLRRLGIPLILLVVFFVPIITYIGHLSHTKDATGFLHFWWQHLPTVFSLEPVLFDDPLLVARHANDFHQWHLWFISLLLLFYLLLSPFGRRLTHTDQTDAQGQSPSPGTIFAYLLTTGLLISLVMAMVNIFSIDWIWLKIGSVLLIQPTRVPLYAGLFILGALAWHKNWFKTEPLPLKPWVWAGASLGLILALLVGLKHFMTQPQPPPFAMSFYFAGMRTFSCLALIGLFTTLTQRHLYKATPSYRTLYPASYDIYLIHLPIVVLLQRAALSLDLPIGVKFVVISLAASLISWALSRYVIQSRPRLAVVLLLAVFLGFGAVL